MVITDDMLSEATKKVSEEFVENWEREHANCMHQFSEEFEEKMRNLISEHKQSIRRE